MLLTLAFLVLCPTGDDVQDGSARIATDSAPNILFLFSDDHSFDAVHALGNAEIHTPNLDRLVARGTVFTHAYNMGAWGGAVCVASRTMLVTGRTLFRAGAERGRLQQRYLDTGQSWPQLLQAAGYRTGLTGKWHVSMDATRAFSEVRHLRPGMPKQTERGYNRPLKNQGDSWDPADPRHGGYWQGGTHWSEVVADDAIEMLADEDPRPFFLYCAFNAPHDPRQSPRAFLDQYPPKSLSLPQPFLAEYPHKDAMGAGPGLRDERLAPFPRTPGAVRVQRAEYYAIISHLDAQIGRVLDALEQSNKARDTWVVYTSDHGLACGHHGLMGKQNMYEHSLRVPFIVVGPGVEAGRRIDAPIYLQDVMPTVLELAKAERPEHVEFRSLLPLLRDPTKAPRRAEIFGSYTDSQRMILAEGHKLILYPKAQVWRLFDLRRDPDEAADLASSAESLELARRLFARLEQQQRKLGDPLLLDEGYPALRGPAPPDDTAPPTTGGSRPPISDLRREPWSARRRRTAGCAESCEDSFERSSATGSRH